MAIKEELGLTAYQEIQLLARETMNWMTDHNPFKICFERSHLGKIREFLLDSRIRIIV